MTKRTAILDELVTRMKLINGVSPYIHNLANRVDKTMEEVDISRQDFIIFPKMFIYATPVNVEYRLGGVLWETLDVRLITGFNAMLTSAQFDDYVSDMTSALGDDLKLNLQADYARFTSFRGSWLEEDNITKVEARLLIEYRRLKTER